jgi:hypothetical protein
LPRDRGDVHTIHNRCALSLCIGIAATLRSDETLDADEEFWLIYISEEESAALVTHELAFDAAREALVAAASRQSGVFPAVLGRRREGYDSGPSL